MQLRDLAQLADRRQFRLYKEYCDEGVSGAKATRSALEAVLADAKKAKFGAILDLEAGPPRPLARPPGSPTGGLPKLER
jgi:hypothetical protein